MMKYRLIAAAIVAFMANAAMAQHTLEDSITWGNLTPQQVENIMGMASKGHSTSQYYLGRCYFNGLCVQKDRYKAVENYGLAAEKDQTEALYWLGFCYRYGYGVPKNEAKATQLFTQAVKWLNEEIDKNPYAPFYLAMCYNYGFGVDVDHDKAVQMYEKAAEMGIT